MKRILFTAVCTASLMAFGCDDKSTANKAPTPEMEKATDKVNDQGVKAMDAAQKDAKGGAAEAEKMAGGDKPMAAAAEDLRGQIADLLGKAKQNMNDKKYDDAENFVQQAKTLKSKLPADMQAQFDASIADAEKAIAAGKTMMAPAK